MARILIISLSALKHDSRVLRQLDELRKEHDVTIASHTFPVNFSGKKIALNHSRRKIWVRIRDGLTLFFGANATHYWRQIPEVQELMSSLKQVQYDVVLANDLPALPVSLSLSNDTAVVFDAHEYSPSQYPILSLWTFFFRRYNNWICRTYLQQADALMTVGAAIGQLYVKKYNLDPLIVIPSAPGFENLDPGVCRSDRIRLVYQGVAGENRGVETLIDAMGLVSPDFELNLVLVGATDQRIDALQRRVPPGVTVNFHEPVPVDEVSAFLNQFDIGLFFPSKRSLSEDFCMPNKFYEWVQARLAMVIGPLPAMAEQVRSLNLGRVAAGFSSRDLADELNSLTVSEVAEFKTCANDAAALLSWEANADLFRSVIVQSIKSK